MTHTLRAQLTLGPDSDQRRYVETMQQWAERALLSLPPASASNSDRQRAAESP
jgi:RNase P subunit RPR2